MRKYKIKYKRKFTELCVYFKCLIHNVKPDYSTIHLSNQGANFDLSCLILI